MRINRLSHDGFVAIRNEWNQLLQDSGSDSIFLTWEWVFTWWDVFGDNRKALYILTAHDEGGKLIGIAPCYAIRRRGLKVLPIREMRFIGFGENVTPEYLDFITLPERRAEVTSAFLKYFMNNEDDWDVLNLTDLFESSQTIDVAKEFQWGNGNHVIQAKSACCPYAVLPDNWETYIGSLSKNSRYDIRRKLRKLDREFDVNLFRWSELSTIESAINKLAELHIKRWEQKTLHYSFSDNKYMRFHQAVAHEFLHRELLRLYVLELDGISLAMLYCFRYKGRLFYYQSGFDPEYSQYGLGTVIFAYAIRDAIAEGIGEIDFLRGNHNYKRKWANAERNTVRLIIRNGGFMGKICVIDFFGGERIKNYLKRRCPLPVYDLLRGAKHLFKTERIKAFKSHFSSQRIGKRPSFEDTK